MYRAFDCRRRCRQCRAKTAVDTWSAADEKTRAQFGECGNKSAGNRPLDRAVPGTGKPDCAGILNEIVVFVLHMHTSKRFWKVAIALFSCCFKEKEIKVQKLRDCSTRPIALSPPGFMPSLAFGREEARAHGRARLMWWGRCRENGLIIDRAVHCISFSHASEQRKSIVLPSVGFIHTDFPITVSLRILYNVVHIFAKKNKSTNLHFLHQDTPSP